MERYFQRANELMNLANLCADEEAANILKAGSMKILELVQSHGGLIKIAKIDSENESE